MECIVILKKSISIINVSLICAVEKLLWQYNPCLKVLITRIIEVITPKLIIVDKGERERVKRKLKHKQKNKK